MPDGRGSSSGPLVAKGKVIQGMGGCQHVRRAEVLHQRLRRRDRQAAVALQHGGERRRTWRRHLGQRCSSLFRAGGETWITGSYDPDLNLTYWGTAQAKPWMPVSRGMYTLDKALYTSSTLALDVDTGKLAWHFSARARRSARPRHRLRARARRQRRTESRVHGRQGRRAVEARSQDGQVSRSQGERVPERLGKLRSEDRRAALPRGHHRPRSRPVDRRMPEHRGRTQLAGDEPQQGHQPADHPAQPELHRDSRAEDRAESRAAAAAAARTGASTRCRAPTATSASSRHST